MNRSLAQLYQDGLALLKRRNASGDFLLLAFAAFVASLVLTNNYNLPPRIFLLTILPAAFSLYGSIIVRSSWPVARLSISFATKLTFSLILLASLVYVIVLTLSSWSQPDFDRRMVDQLWLHAALIMLFMTITAHAVAFVDRFLIRLVAVVVPLIAISAGLNIWKFVSALPTSSSIFDIRLVNWLGMPGYVNSTNISLTYAVFFMAAIAVIVARDVRWWMKLSLAPFAAILLFATLLTQARSAYLGTAVSVMVILFLTRDFAFWNKIGLRLSVAALVFGVAIGSVVPLKSVLTNRRESLRPEIWTTYLGKAKIKPWLGYGNSSNIDITVNNGFVVDQPHNLILSSQIRGGVACMLAMLTILAACGWCAIRFQRQRKCAIPLAMIATIIPTAMFDYNLLITSATWPWLTFWLPFAICAGAEIALRDAKYELATVS